MTHSGGRRSLSLPVVQVKVSCVRTTWMHATLPVERGKFVVNVVKSWYESLLVLM